MVYHRIIQSVVMNRVEFCVWPVHPDQFLGPLSFLSGRCWCYCIGDNAVFI